MLSIRGKRVLAAGAVLALSACGGGGDGESADTGDGGDGGGAANELEFHSTNDFKFDPPSATTSAGETRIVHENDGNTLHTFVIEGLDFKISDSGEKDVELAEGEYVFYCDVPGHREAGMEGTITVSP